MPASLDDESFDASLPVLGDEPPIAPVEADEPEPEEAEVEPELALDGELPVDEEPMAPDEPEVPPVDDDDEPMLPDEPAALPPVAPVLPLELTELVDGLALDDEPPLMLPDDEPVLPEEPLAPFWLLEPDCRSLFRPDCWSLPMLLPAPWRPASTPLPSLDF